MPSRAGEGGLAVDGAAMSAPSLVARHATAVVARGCDRAVEILTILVTERVVVSALV